MVLENLSTKLKDSLSKIAKSMFVDDRLIDELIKDLQRALLQADVNVQLVFDLSKNIKARIKEEKTPAGLTQKEHLINIVYEELTKFIGGEKNEIKIDKKPFKILLVGLYGSGKCVHPKSKIPLTSGEILEAEKLYNKFNSLKKEQVEDGEIIKVQDYNILVPSFNPHTLKIENKRVTHLWKLKGKDLIAVYLDNGNDFSVKVTPEHPFFVMRKGELLQVRADELNEEDYAAVPRKFEANNTGLVSLFDYLKNMNLDVYLNKSEVKESIGEKTLTEIHKNLKFKRNYCSLTTDVKNGKIPISCLETIDSPTVKVKLKSAFKPVYFPTHITSDLAEFLGYVTGDGHLTKRGIEIFNEDKEIICRVIELFESLFGMKPEIMHDPRTKDMYRIRVSSVTLSTILNKIFKLPFGKKGRKLGIPSLLLTSSNYTLKSFIRAYFDCDGSVENNSRGIEITSESETLIDQISLALLRYGILSTKACKKANKLDYFRLIIRARYAEEYYSKIGFLAKKKSDRASKFGTIGIKQGHGKQDMIPLARKIKELRESLGFSIGEIQTKIESYSRYEDTGLISRSKLLKTADLYSNKEGNIKSTLANIDRLNEKFSQPFINSLVAHLSSLGLIIKESNTTILTKNGQVLLSKLKENTATNQLEFFKNLAESDVCWIRVKDIKPISNDANYVYDLTVEDNHSFIADNIIVHNTTQAGKLAKFYQKRGYKIGLVQTDTWRPAAYKQLQTLGEQINVPVYGSATEKDPLKILKDAKKHFKDFDIVIIDSAGRDALSDELITEIETLNKELKPNEVILVISADIGQAAQKQAEQFHKSCNVTGIVATKMDGTAKAGGALSACSVTGAPVKFIGTGEKIDDLEQFNPKGFVGRMLGMGDLEALLEKAKEAMTEEDAEALGKKFLKGDFNFLDLYEQLQAMGKMGSMTKIMEMIPGLGGIKIPKEMIQGQENKLKIWKHIMQSMTKEELEDPEILTSGRIDRIAAGAGHPASEVRQLLKQFRQTKKLMKMAKGANDPNKLLKKFKGKIPGL
ncbi:MAG: LAGLIDADG family homing endonuclease [archaeon]